MGRTQLIMEIEAILGRKLTPEEAYKVWEYTSWGLVNPYDIIRELEGA